MSLPRRLPPAEPDPALLALFEQPDRIPQAVRRQAEFFVFFARTVFPLLETYRERLAAVYTRGQRPAGVGSGPVCSGVLVLQFVLRVPDRQAAEPVQYDQRWRLALHLRPAGGDLRSLAAGRLSQPAGGGRAGRAGLCRRARLSRRAGLGAEALPATAGLDACARAA